MTPKTLTNFPLNNVWNNAMYLFHNDRHVINRRTRLFWFSIQLCFFLMYSRYLRFFSSRLVILQRHYKLQYFTTTVDTTFSKWPLWYHRYVVPLRVFTKNTFTQTHYNKNDNSILYTLYNVPFISPSKTTRRSVNTHRNHNKQVFRESKVVSVRKTSYTPSVFVDRLEIVDDFRDNLFTILLKTRRSLFKRSEVLRTIEPDRRTAARLVLRYILNFRTSYSRRSIRKEADSTVLHYCSRSTNEWYWLRRLCLTYQRPWSNEWIQSRDDLSPNKFRSNVSSIYGLCLSVFGITFSPSEEYRKWKRRFVDDDRFRMDKFPDQETPVRSFFTVYETNIGNSRRFISLVRLSLSLSKKKDINPFSLVERSLHFFIGYTFYLQWEDIDSLIRIGGIQLNSFPIQPSGMIPLIYNLDLLTICITPHTISSIARFGYIPMYTRYVSTKWYLLIFFLQSWNLVFQTHTSFYKRTFFSELFRLCGTTEAETAPVQGVVRSRFSVRSRYIYTMLWPFKNVPVHRCLFFEVEWFRAQYTSDFYYTTYDSEATIDLKNITQLSERFMSLDDNKTRPLATTAHSSLRNVTLRKSDDILYWEDEYTRDMFSDELYDGVTTYLRLHFSTICESSFFLENSVLPFEIHQYRKISARLQIFFLKHLYLERFKKALKNYAIQHALTDILFNDIIGVYYTHRYVPQFVYQPYIRSTPSTFLETLYTFFGPDVDDICFYIPQLNSYYTTHLYMMANIITSYFLSSFLLNNTNTYLSWETCSARTHMSPMSDTYKYCIFFYNFKDHVFKNTLSFYYGNLTNQSWARTSLSMGFRPRDYKLD